MKAVTQLIRFKILAMVWLGMKRRIVDKQNQDWPQPPMPTAIQKISLHTMGTGRLNAFRAPAIRCAGRWRFRLRAAYGAGIIAR